MGALVANAVAHPGHDVVGVLGAVLFALALTFTFFAPLLAIALVIASEYWGSLMTLVAWLLWLKFGNHIRRLVYDGFEHGSL
jgi:hypothetical protein